MSKVRVKTKVKLAKLELDKKGVGELLQDPGIGYKLQHEGWKIAKEAGHAYANKPRIFKDRMAVLVAQNQTTKDMEENTLLKAVQFTND